MRLRELIVAGSVCVSIMLFAGCQSGSGGGGGSGEVAANDGMTGDTYGFTLDDVDSDPVGNVNFLPDAGTATLILGTEGPGALTIEITFTEDTPTDGNVLVSVNGSSPVVLSLEDVYYIQE